MKILKIEKNNFGRKAYTKNVTAGKRLTLSGRQHDCTDCSVWNPVEFSVLQRDQEKNIFFVHS